MHEDRCQNCPSYKAIGCWDGRDPKTGQHTHGVTMGCTNPDCEINKEARRECEAERERIRAINRENDISAADFVKARQEAGVTIREAARCIGVTAPHYSDWEHERKAISPLAHEALMEYFRRAGNDL